MGVKTEVERKELIRKIEHITCAISADQDGNISDECFRGASEELVTLIENEIKKAEKRGREYAAEKIKKRFSVPTITTSQFYDYCNQFINKD